MTIHLHDETGYVAARRPLFEAIQLVLHEHDQPDADVCLVFLSDEEIRSLNRQFRGEDRVTDVLSFPNERGGACAEAAGAESRPYLGDIIVAHAHVQDLAQQERQPVEDWLLLLVVHGTLHLLGYHHEEEDAQEEMWQVQARALSQLGICEESIERMIQSSLQRSQS
ncbi:MAG: rRNA maturation RNase YbeY [Chloroflexi bacterium]|nr:rRNA maturation RNase YbeY [Chloroflexota bacterium]